MSGSSHNTPSVAGASAVDAFLDQARKIPAVVGEKARGRLVFALHGSL